MAGRGRRVAAGAGHAARDRAGDTLPCRCADEAARPLPGNASASRSPATGAIAVTVGKRTTRLGSVAVDVPRDPLVQDPITIAAEPSGSLVVGQLRAAPLLRIAHARAAKVADGPGVFHVYVAGRPSTPPAATASSTASTARR